jgi:ABC-2 type transport system ATP-binding protein
MSTPYLDEAERCARVALMNKGRIMVVETPQNVKRLMTGDVIEIICEHIRSAASVLKANARVRDVQAFGDRLNIVLDDAKRDLPEVERALHEANIRIAEIRVVNPSLENVFISLMSREATG